MLQPTEHISFRTEVSIPQASFRINHDSRLLLLGSCFSDNIGERLLRAGFNAQINPFGTLYNPLSIAMVLSRLLDNQPLQPEEIQSFRQEGYGSWLSHTLLSRPTSEETLSLHNDILARAAEHLRHTDVLLITFGTAWVYRLADTRMVVSNCHHELPSRFIRECLSVEDILTNWTTLIHHLHTTLPNLRIIFTVSPIRHLRDGAHANQLSKATLLLAINHLLHSSHNPSHTSEEPVPNSSPDVGEVPALHYFPAYELLLDDLRDYRFYADDMLHPSPVAIDYIWNRFSATYFDAPTLSEAARHEKAFRASAHRPLRT